MSQVPSFAVVLEGGLVQAILVQDWPAYLPLPTFAVVDYDTEGADEDEITHFPIDNTEAEAVCRSEMPVVHECLPGSLSPRTVLAALDDLGADDAPDLLAMARQVRQSILDLDVRLNAKEQAPTGSDYNELYVLANCGLIDLLKSLRDTATFGE